MKNTILNKSELLRKCSCADIILSYVENIKRNYWIFDICSLKQKDDVITYVSRFYNTKNNDTLTAKCYLNEHDVYVLSSEVKESN